MNNNHLHIIEDSRLTLYMLKNSLNDIYFVSVSSDRKEFIDFLKRGTNVEQAFDILVEIYNKFKKIDNPGKVNYLNNKKILDLYGDR